ncbi:UPF0175 family protein [Nonomuraea sp. NPDC050404]|uniref:UPF0175 family protein n=1 Tax=Nonomuraea sp. NPDC050404 TaxID=3155783 RepID=UPI0033D16212
MVGKRKGYARPSNARLRSLYEEQHKTVMAIATSLDAPRWRVRQWLAEAGIAVRRGGGQKIGVSAEEWEDRRARAVKLYREESPTLGEVAKWVGVSRVTVRAWLSDAGVGRCKGGKAPVEVDVSREELARLYERERSVARVGAALGVGRDVARRLLREAGVKVPRGAKSEKERKASMSIPSTSGSDGGMAVKRAGVAGLGAHAGEGGRV